MHDAPLNKNTSAGTVKLQWSGGLAPFTLQRAQDPAMGPGRIVLVNQASTTTKSDPVLLDANSYYYLVP